MVGFSMGGGEVARYLARYGSERVKKAVLAAAVPPCRYKSKDNPAGVVDDAAIAEMQSAVKADRLAFLNKFSQRFFTAGSLLKASEAQRQYAVDIAAFASPKGTVDCIAAFGRTDFREDLRKMTIPTLVIHGDSDGVVPFEGSGKLTAASIVGAKLVVIEGGPHGINVSHADEFNAALLAFLRS